MWLKFRFNWKDLPPVEIPLELPLMNRLLLHVFAFANLIIFKEQLDIELERFVFFDNILNILVNIRKVFLNALKPLQNVYDRRSLSLEVRFWPIHVPILFWNHLGLLGAHRTS